MSFACGRCDKEAVIVRVSYRVDNTLFVGVPVYVCKYKDCVEKIGGETFKHRELTKPPSETDMQQAKPKDSEGDKYGDLRLIYDDWVKAGKPGYFSEWIGKIEDVKDG